MLVTSERMTRRLISVGGECELCHVGESLSAADSTRDGTRRVPGAPKRHSANFPPRSGIPRRFWSVLRGRGGGSDRTICDQRSRDICMRVIYKRALSINFNISRWLNDKEIYI